MTNLAALELKRVGKRFFVCSHEGGQLLACCQILRSRLRRRTRKRTHLDEVLPVFGIHLSCFSSISMHRGRTDPRRCVSREKERQSLVSDAGEKGDCRVLHDQLVASNNLESCVTGNEDLTPSWLVEE